MPVMTHIGLKRLYDTHRQLETYCLNSEAPLAGNTGWRGFDWKRDPVGIRTQDPQLRRLLLYPAELQDHPVIA